MIRQELTEVTGVTGSSRKHPDSVLYDGYRASATKYSALDKEVIRLMYGGVVQAGDDKKAITAKVTVKK